MKNEYTGKTRKGRPVGLLLRAGLVWLLLAGCANPFDQGDVRLPDAALPDTAGNGTVTIRIAAAGSSARTVYPDTSELAGYQLTFASESGARDPVSIASGSTSETVALPDGEWTITGTAYTGAVETGTKVAKGSIIITLAGSKPVDSGGNPVSIPDIILKPFTEDFPADGTLNYTISTNETVSGAMSLWTIVAGGTLTEVTAFGTKGVMDINQSSAAAVSLTDETVNDLAAGRCNGNKAYKVRRLHCLLPGSNGDLARHDHDHQLYAGGG